MPEIMQRTMNSTELDQKTDNIYLNNILKNRQYSSTTTGNIDFKSIEKVQELADLVEKLENEKAIQEQKQTLVNDGFDSDEDELDELEWPGSDGHQTIFGQEKQKAATVGEKRERSDSQSLISYGQNVVHKRQRTNQGQALLEAKLSLNVPSCDAPLGRRNAAIYMSVYNRALYG